MRMFDADNHFYEAHDAFTRHVPERFHKRGVQWITLENGHKRHLALYFLAPAYHRHRAIRDCRGGTDRRHLDSDLHVA